MNKIKHLSEKQKDLCVLLVLFLIAFLFRFFFISQGPHHVDCFLLAQKAQSMVDDQKLYYLQASGLPLVAIFGALFVWISKLFSVTDTVMVVNFMNVVFSTLCVMALYLFVKYLSINRGKANGRTHCFSCGNQLHH